MLSVLFRSFFLLIEFLILYLQYDELRGLILASIASLIKLFQNGVDLFFGKLQLLDSFELIDVVQAFKHMFNSEFKFFNRSVAKSAKRNDIIFGCQSLFECLLIQKTVDDFVQKGIFD